MPNLYRVPGIPNRRFTLPADAMNAACEVVPNDGIGVKNPNDWIPILMSQDEIDAEQLEADKSWAEEKDKMSEVDRMEEIERKTEREASKSNGHPTEKFKWPPNRELYYI